MAGQRAVLDVVEQPTGGGSAGIAVDVSELEAVRVDLQRQMDAQFAPSISCRPRWRSSTARRI